MCWGHPVSEEITLFLLLAALAASPWWTAVSHLRPPRRSNQPLVGAEGSRDLPEGILVLDRELRCLVWSARLEEATGVAASDIVGRPFPHSPDGPFRASVERALAGETVHLPESAYRLEDGRSGRTRCRISAWRDAGGRVAGVVVAIRDTPDSG